MSKLLDSLWKPRVKAALFLTVVSLVFMVFLFPRAARISGSTENRSTDLQKAFTTAQFESVITTWSKTGDNAVGLVKRENIIKLDLVFPVLYSLALALSFAALAGGRPRTRWSTLFLVAPFVAGALDLAENVTHLYLLSGIDTSAQVDAAVRGHVFDPTLVFLAASFAHVKYALLLLSLLAVAAEGGRRVWRFIRNPSRGGGARAPNA